MDYFVLEKGLIKDVNNLTVYCGGHLSSPHHSTVSNFLYDGF